jgi:hypothetical protein
MKLPTVATSLLCLALCLIGQTSAQAQDPFAGMPEDGKPLAEPTLNSFSPVIADTPTAHPGKNIHLEARLTEKGAPMKYGLDRKSVV